MAEPETRIEHGVEWVTIHHPKTGGETEVPLADWDQDDTGDGGGSYADKGWKLGKAPSESAAKSTTTAATAAKEG